jgi:hypothetical protein
MSFVIVKHVKQSNGVFLPVIILDGLGEVLTFDSETEAQSIKNIFDMNSDSNHKYEVKHINEKIK